MTSRKKSILFIGNCQVQALSQLYERFAGRRAREIVTFLPTYENLSDANRQAIVEADLIVEQRLDMAPKADIGGVETSAERHFVPLLACGFLWPFAGQPHPHNETLSYMGSGPYDAEMSDGYMNRLIAKGVPADQGAEQYIALDVNTARSLDRMFELIIDRQRARDEFCGFDIASVIETYFRAERLFRTPHHPDLRIALSFAEQFFDKLAVDPFAKLAMREQLHETPFPKDMLPIHPSVGRHFGLTYADQYTRYRYRSEGFFTFAEYAHRYMRYEWNRELAQGLSLSNQPDLALPLIEAGLRKSPDAAEGYNSYADLLHRLNRHADALDAVDRAIALDPSVGRYYYRRSHILNALGRASEAVHSISQALTLDQSDAHFYGFDAHLAVHRGDLPTAEVAARNAVRIAPYDATFHRLLGDVLLRQNKLNDALTSAEQAISLAGADEAYIRLRSQILDRLGRSAAASPSSNTFERDTAAQFRLLDEVSQRNPEISRTLPPNPNQAKHYNRLGHHLSQLGQTTEAIAAFQIASQLEPGVADHWASLSHELNRAERASEAIFAVEKAIEISSLNASYYIHLGNLFRILNKYKYALTAYEFVLSIYPEHAEARDRIDSLSNANA